MKDVTKKFWLNVLNNVKLFFTKKENIGILFMLLALIMFFCFANNPIPGFRFPWQAKTLSLRFTLQTGILALIFQLILYMKGIYKSTYNPYESDIKKILKNILFIVINTAIFTTFFSILFAPTTKTVSVLTSAYDVLKGLGIGGGIICGIVLFGTQNTASLATFIFFGLFMYKCWENVDLVSKAAGPIGWFYIVFVVVGFMLQENISIKQLANELINCFSFGKKCTLSVADTTDRCVQKGKEIVSEVVGFNETTIQKKNVNNETFVD